MTETEQDIPPDPDDIHVAGDTALIDDTVTKDDGSVKSLSGASVVFGLAHRPGGTPLVEKDDTSSNVTITDASNGELEVRLGPTDTENLGTPDGKDYYYEIEVTDGSGDPSTVTTGAFWIRSDTI